MTGKWAELPVEYVILGAGAVVQEYYIPALTKLGRISSTRIYDPNEASVAGLKHAFPNVQCRLGDLGAAVADAAVPAAAARSALIVASPNATHPEVVAQGLEAGFDVLCEKPLSLSTAVCAQLRAQAASSSRQLKVAMSRRYLPSLMLARDIIAAGHYGKVEEICVRDCTPFLWRPRSLAFFARDAGGVLADMGVHYLDYLDCLVGPLEPVSYEDDAQGGTESSLSYVLRGGAVSIELRLSRLHRLGAFIELSCEGARIRIDKGCENDITISPNGGPTRKLVVERPFEDPTWPAEFHGSFCQMLRDFERALVGEDSGIADAADAERAAGLIEWAYQRRDRRVSARLTSNAKAAPKVLVTGATGFIGGHLIERLSAQDLSLRATARAPAQCANLARFPVEIVPLDLLDRASVRAAVEGARVVYHLAYGKDGPNPQRVTVEGTRNIVEAAIAAGADCVVILSTMYVFGFPKTHLAVDESFPYRPYGGEYARSKAAMERFVLERAKSSLPTRIVVLNPTCVYGPAGGAYTSLPVDLARNGQFCWIDKGSGLGNYTYVGNVVDAMLRAAETPPAHGERFIINDGAVSWRAFIEPLLGPLAANIPSYSRREFARLPRYGGPFRWKDLLSAAASSAEVRNVAKRSARVRAAFAWANRHWPRPPMGADTNIWEPKSISAISQAPPDWLGDLFGSAHVIFSAAKAGRLLNWPPRIDLPTGQALTIDWLIEDGRLASSSQAS